MEASSEPECPLLGLKTTYKTVFRLYRCHTNLGADPDWIRIQQQSGSRSGFSKCLDLGPDSVIADPKNCLKRNFNTYSSDFFAFLGLVCNSVEDPESDPHVFGPPGSGSISRRYGSGSGVGSFFFHINVWSGLK